MSDCGYIVFNEGREEDQERKESEHSDRYLLRSVEEMVLNLALLLLERHFGGRGDFRGLSYAVFLNWRIMTL